LPNVARKRGVHGLRIQQQTSRIGRPLLLHRITSVQDCSVEWGSIALLTGMGAQRKLKYTQYAAHYGCFEAFMPLVCCLLLPACLPASALTPVLMIVLIPIPYLFFS
jgi:hypothetical protein